MRKITTRILIGLLIAVMFSVFVRLGTWEILIKRLKMDNVFTRAVFFDAEIVFEETAKEEDLPLLVDFKEKYPFTTNKKPFVDTSSVIAEDKRTEEYDTATVIGKIKKHINFFFKNRLLLYDAGVNLALRYEAGINWYLNDNAIRIGKNYWVFLADKKSPVDDVVASINDFHEFLYMKNIPLLYVVAPNKLSPDSAYLFVNQKEIDKDFVLSELRKNKIQVLDLRENIRAENKDWHSLFYNTDHHWRVETSLWASKIIAEKLNSDFDFDLNAELLNPWNFNHKLYKNWYLGSIGKKVGHLLARPDDFVLITPKFETKFDATIKLHGNNMLIEKENTIFDSTFINFAQIDKRDYYNLDTYVGQGSAHYLYSHNKLNKNAKKILLVSDSYGMVVAPFLALTTYNIININLRVFNGSLETFVEKENPDIVILLFHSVDGGKWFDFR
jgi:hypothetical protein